MAIATLPFSFSLLPSRRSQDLHYLWSSNPHLSRRSLCCSGMKSRKGRASKTDEELCHELREFISATGLPESRLPSMNELCENGRKDLANIVRRRGYKAITELLLNSNEERHSIKTSQRNQDPLTAGSYEAAGGQERNINGYPDCTSSSSIYSMEHIVKSNGELPMENDAEVCETSTSVDSLRLKAMKFIQTGELDTIEGEDCELHQDLEDSELHQDMASTGLEEHDQNEIYHLKSSVHQKEMELSKMKQDIEDEKLALSNLQARATAELDDIQKIIREKDVEIHAAEEYLNGLKEVHIDYWANGQIVEVAGSFNGWQDKVKLDLHPSSGDMEPPVSRDQLLWSTVLWLYPGVYEIKFIVDGHWKIDSWRQIITIGGITNNVLIVDG
ncbi:hypothetical protein Cni_G16140 [Canna indica]|uniref:AMP-activated protein kinase glycogen-binding domain-containing protein n=1 Tax=Canna indica TaxID=4628 RepID=A0AAQ3KFK3_9LILI|nr:hypothetical protein Cni_G16140 [Canna indica]